MRKSRGKAPTKAAADAPPARTSAAPSIPPVPTLAERWRWVYTIATPVALFWSYVGPYSHSHHAHPLNSANVWVLRIAAVGIAYVAVMAWTLHFRRQKLIKAQK